LFPLLSNRDIQTRKEAMPLLLSQKKRACGKPK